MEKVILKNKENNIICNEHKLIADNICLEKGCKKVINCYLCKIDHNKNHSNFISILSLFNENLVNGIFEEKSFSEELNLKKIKEILNISKKWLDEEFKKLKDYFTEEIKKKSFEYNFVLQKNIFKFKKLEFVKNNGNLEKLVNLGRELTNLFRLKISDNFYKSEIIFKNIQNNLDLFFNNIKKEFEKLKIIKIFERKENINKIESPNEKIKNFDNLIKTEKKFFSENKEKINNIKKENIYYERKEENKKILPLPKLKRKIFIESSLIKSQQDLNFINNLFPKKIKKTKLLFKAYNNNIKIKEFITNLYNKGNYFSIIKVKDSKNIFGFFNPLGLIKKANGKFYQTKDSFLYSLTNKEKLKCLNSNFSILHFDNEFPQFGIGPDLKIFENNYKACFSNLGNTYKLPKGWSKKQSKTFLGGKKKFFLEIIEIYKIN